jgi:hypothetical protein
MTAHPAPSQACLVRGSGDLPAAPEAVGVPETGIEEDARRGRITGTNPLGADDRPVRTPLVEVRRRAHVGRHVVTAFADSVDDDQQLHINATGLEAFAETNGGAPAETVSVDDQVGLSRIGESATDEFIGQFDFVIFHRFDERAGLMRGADQVGDACRQAFGVVPPFPTADDAEGQGLTGSERKRRGEVGEDLVSAVGWGDRGE